MRGQHTSILEHRYLPESPFVPTDPFTSICAPRTPRGYCSKLLVSRRSKQRSEELASLGLRLWVR